MDFMFYVPIVPCQLLVLKPLAEEWSYRHKQSQNDEISPNLNGIGKMGGNRASDYILEKPNFTIMLNGI